MSENTVRESLERELKEIEASEMLTPAYKRKKLIAYAIRTTIAAIIYIYFWEYIWLRWTLLFYVPLNLVGLGLILGAEHFVHKKLENTRRKIDELEV